MQEMGSSREEHHVAVLVFPFASHTGPLLNLVQRLAAAAPNVRFSFFSTSWSNASIFSGPNAKTLDNIKAYNVWDGMPFPAPEGGHAGAAPPPAVTIEERIAMFMQAAPDSFKKGMDEAVAESGGRKISCLVSEAFLWFCGLMAEEMNVPWVPLWTGGPWSISAHIHTDLIRETIGVGGIAGREGEAINFIPGFSSLCLGDLPEGIIFGDLESPFSCMLRNMGLMLPKATAVAMNFYEELDPTTITKDLKSKLKNLLGVGPFTLTSPSPPSNISDEHGCLAFLDKHKTASVAYIAFGTLLTPQPNELVALAEALEESKVPFLWSFKGNIEDNLPKGFLKRTGEKGKIVPWAPQLQVLQHSSTGVYVTHSGWNSVVESITGGVPMICRPVFADQGLNARMIKDVWKIGVGVEGGVFTKSGIMKALELMLLLEEGKKMRENIGVLKELAIKAVGSNGSSDENFKALLEVVTKS